MSVVPGVVDTDQQPPMAVPLRHFVVALGFLVSGGIVGGLTAVDVLSATGAVAHVHLLLVGWVCVTIMGAMTQFVPVWSGTELYSRRLASRQLWLVTVGLVGFAGGLLSERLVWLPAFGALMLLGFWTFAYNVGRTLWTLDEYDVTERHFGLALGFFVVLTPLGLLLALDFVRPVFVHLPVTRTSVVGAHATLAVFGAVLTTVLGALYQLSTMFTQTELHGIDHGLERVEEMAYPVGVLTLAGGRLGSVAPVATIGGVLVTVGVAAVGVVLGRRLLETRVERTPMLSRYAVAAVSMVVWAVVTLPVWLRDPLAPATRFGPPGTTHLLSIGVVGFVVLGTLYHVVPFVVWVHRYSDLLGFEDVPTIDDLYDDRVATVDFVAVVVGGTGLVVADLFPPVDNWTIAAGSLLVCGLLLFSWNLLTVLREHSPTSLAETVLPWLTTGRSVDTSTSDPDRSNE